MGQQEQLPKARALSLPFRLLSESSRGRSRASNAWPNVNPKKLQGVPHCALCPVLASLPTHSKE